VSPLRAHHDEAAPQTEQQSDRVRSATARPIYLLIHVRRSCTTIRISAPLAWSAINAILFALDARLPYSLSEEQAYDDHTNLVS
jgi:hypothetical protein